MSIYLAFVGEARIPWHCLIFITGSRWRHHTAVCNASSTINPNRPGVFNEPLVPGKTTNNANVLY